MTALIRSMGDLVEGLRCAQIERSISYETIEHIAGMAQGSVAKYLAPEPSKNLGPLSAFDIALGVGKALVLVDDIENIEAVRKYWKKRAKTGGASMQMVAREAVGQASRASITVEMQETTANCPQHRTPEFMKRIGKLGASKGGKRRAKAMGKRRRQRIASHAARVRWHKDADALSEPPK